MIGTPNWKRMAHVEETHKEMAYFQIDRLRDVIEGFEERAKEAKARENAHLDRIMKLERELASERYNVEILRRMLYGSK